MQNKITKPKRCLVENDEFFYRHPEMYRTKLDDEVDEYDSLSSENVENVKNEDRN